MVHGTVVYSLRYEQMSGVVKVNMRYPGARPLSSGAASLAIMSNNEQLRITKVVLVY